MNSYKVARTQPECMVLSYGVIDKEQCFQPTRWSHILGAKVPHKKEHFRPRGVLIPNGFTACIVQEGFKYVIEIKVLPRNTANILHRIFVRDMHDQVYHETDWETTINQAYRSIPEHLRGLPGRFKTSYLGIFYEPAQALIRKWFHEHPQSVRFNRFIINKWLGHADDISTIASEEDEVIEYKDLLDPNLNEGEEEELGRVSGVDYEILDELVHQEQLSPKSQRYQKRQLRKELKKSLMKLAPLALPPPAPITRSKTRKLRLPTSPRKKPLCSRSLSPDELKTLLQSGE